MPGEQGTTTVQDQGAPPAVAPRRGSEGRGGPAARPLVWRLHYVGGFLLAPVLLWLAVSGILYAWHPQIQEALYGEVLSASSEGAPRPLADQVAAAQAERPGWAVHSVTPGAVGGATTGVMLGPPHPGSGGHHGGFGPPEGAVSVYVDPASAAVTGEIAEAQRPEEWLRSLHSSGTLGVWAEPVSELAASWALVALLSGVYLWWPRRGRTGGGERRARSPRAVWRSRHTAIGLVAALPLACLIVTGLTWTNAAGAWLDAVRAAVPSDPPEPATELDGSHTRGTGGHESHTGLGADAGDAADIDRVAAAARDAGLEGEVVLEPPHAGGQAWTAALTDRTWPVRDTELAIDGSRGAVVDRVDWDEHPPLAQATTIGIAFHQGELFGPANQVLLTAIALALIALIGAGYRMWWSRRPSGGLPPLPPIGPLLRRTRLPLLLGGALLLILLPTLAAALALLLAAEALAARRRRRNSTSG